ncbi:hypothetical protein [Alloyangia pacifica]|uniref:hypothetical protein n=1 Tax=Alloyangia pacifica TaxID=311180 RepID=UPI001CFCC139|nr:hypothetical protein [Alloyangia pacifica]
MKILPASKSFIEWNHGSRPGPRGRMALFHAWLKQIQPGRIVAGYRLTRLEPDAP